MEVRELRPAVLSRLLQHCISREPLICWRLERGEREVMEHSSEQFW